MREPGDAQQKPDTPGNVQVYPYQSDLLAQVAASIIEENLDALPDIGHQVILLANPLAAPQLRRHLVEHATRAGCPGLLGPHILGLRDWIESNYPSLQNRLTEQERLLILLSALRQHRNLPGADQPWLLAENLLTLFDELDAFHIDLGDELDAFHYRLAQAYGKTDVTNPVIDAQLGREARLVFTLWRAWREQLKQEQRIDSHTDYRHKLSLSLQDCLSNKVPRHIWLVGFEHFIPAELDWVQAMLQHGALTLVMHGDAGNYPATHPGAVAADLRQRLQANTVYPDTGQPAKSAFLDAVFDNRDDDFVQRARAFARTVPMSPVASDLAVLHAENDEQQAHAIDLQVRNWLREGKQQIGIVTQDRRLARRLRALLDRSNIVLQDSAGWALSTTSAAAALERWLECIELDFDYLPLLDLLKSAFIDIGLDSETLRQHVYRFEQDIILREGITSNLSRYQAMLASRRERLQAIWPHEIYDKVEAILAALQHAAQPLLRFVDRNPHDAASYLDALLESTRRLGMYDRLDSDPAGNRILEEIEQLSLAARRHPVKMRRHELRNWLARSLERFTFKPSLPARAVQLLDLLQARLIRFDAVVIAGADRGHLPGMVATEPFFNEAVRMSLGLPGKDLDSRRRFYAFRALLDHADTILLSTNRLDMNGDPVLDSPWLEAVTRFHLYAYSSNLEAEQLATQLAASHAVLQDTRGTLPTITQPPAPRVDAALRAERISATDYQNLVNCPYRYYASRCLGLRAPDEISEVLARNELGERIHRCLQAFHTQVDHLPQPFTEPLTMANRERAITQLETISRNVFARDIESHFEHRDWLRQWQLTIPAYIDWQINRAAHWQVHDTEQQVQRERVTIGLPLYGRLDRVDLQGNSFAIIDYKTGGVPKPEMVASGEAVQLPFYALLHEGDVGQVEYLAIDISKQVVESKVVLEGGELDRLVDAHSQRLAQLSAALREGVPLPATANDTCSNCEMDGLCRVDYWPDPVGEQA